MWKKRIRPNKQDKLQRDRQRQLKRSRRLKRRERIAKLLGIAAGYMFNTRMVGWVAVIVAGIIGIILVYKVI